MAVDIERAINLLQAQNRSISVEGMSVTAPDADRYPSQITTANLPYIITWPAGGSWYQKGHGYALDSRTFRILAFVQPLGQSDAPTRLVPALKLLQAVRDHYLRPVVIQLGDPGLNDGYQFTVESRDGSPHTDDGITPNLTFGGVAFLGFEVRLRVRTQWAA